MFYEVGTRRISAKLQIKIGIVGGGVQLGPLGNAATNRPIVSAPCEYDDGEICGMIGSREPSIRRKPAPMPLFPPQTPHASRMRTRAAAGLQITLDTLFPCAVMLCPCEIRYSTFKQVTSTYFKIISWPLSMFIFPFHWTHNKQCSWNSVVKGTPNPETIYAISGSVQIESDCN
jgi:hypothetical protein